MTSARQDAPHGSTTEPPPSEDGSYTITALAEASGIPERTIRFYRETGLIDPPRRRGRHAFYDADQLPRVRLIAELREAGLSLDAINDMLRNPTAGTKGLAEVLQITDELRTPWTIDAADHMAPDVVLRTCGLDDPAAVGILEAHGVIIRNPGRSAPTFKVPSVRTLQLAGQLLQAGVEPEVAFQAWHLMQDHLADLSHELISLFAEYASSASPDGGPNLDVNFTELQRLGLAAVQLFFAKAIEHELETFVERGGVLEINRRVPIAEAVRFTPPATGPPTGPPAPRPSPPGTSAPR